MKTNLSTVNNKVFAKEIIKFNSSIKINLANKDCFVERKRKNNVIKTEFIKIGGIEIF